MRVTGIPRHKLEMQSVVAVTTLGDWEFDIGFEG